MLEKDEREKLTDVSDRASQVEAEMSEAALGDVRRWLEQDRPALPDGTYERTDCDECGDPVGEQRIRLAPRNRWCINCATYMENKRV